MRLPRVRTGHSTQVVRFRTPRSTTAQPEFVHSNTNPAFPSGMSVFPRVRVWPTVCISFAHEHYGHPGTAKLVVIRDSSYPDRRRSAAHLGFPRNTARRPWFLD